MLPMMSVTVAAAPEISRVEPATAFSLLASIFVEVVSFSVRLPLVRPSTSPARVKPFSIA